MLQSLHIVNFAIIEDTVIDFSKGITVFTGETGAGKSILLDAISMLIGRRAKTDLIRRGSGYFKVEGVFYGEESVVQSLRENGFECEGNQIILSRKLNKNGRGICTINGDFCTVKQLQTVGKMLIRLHEQNDNMELLSIPFCERLVDSSSEKVASLYQAYRLMYFEWKKIRDALDDYENKKQERERRLDILDWELRQISEAALQPGEDEAVEKKLDVLLNREKILRALHNAMDIITTDGGPQDGIGQAAKEISVAARYDEAVGALEETVNSAAFALEEAVNRIESYLSENADFSQQELEEQQDRMEVIQTLKRKYGPEISDVLAYEKKAREEYEELRDVVYNNEELRKKYETLKKELVSAAEKLNQERRISAKNILEKIVCSLKDLGMADARMDLHLIDSAEPTPNGADEMEFYFSANPGEPLRSLRDTASGGEISRIALSIETFISKMIKGQTLIFDEIDVGISGKAALQVAKKFSRLSSEMQILCITHLPQTACVADRHYKIEKQVAEGRTSTHAVLLNERQHLEAIALMLSGTENSASALQSVIEMQQKIRHK